MTATARLLEQRSYGSVRLRMEQRGVAVLREQGASKLRVPRGTTEAILINVSGGLAGGDSVDIAAEVGPGAQLTLTTQAAERVYRTLGPAAHVKVSLRAETDASLLWLPQETILFEGSALHRRMDVELAPGASFFAVETYLFGRHEMGEAVQQVSVNDHWHVRRAGKLLHMEALTLAPPWPGSQARLGNNRAMATLLFISPKAQDLLEPLRHVLGPQDGASAWNGKLVARLVARDGYTLRKTLIQAIRACVGGNGVPKCWTF